MVPDDKTDDKIFVYRRRMRDDSGMRCELVRETLSALLDGEQQHMPAHLVDTHLGACRGCRRWLVGAAGQARRLAVVSGAPGPVRPPDLAEQILAAAGVPRRRPRLAGLGYRRTALLVVGAFQVLVGLAQVAGVDFGMVSEHGHGAATGAHLLHESTAWLLALGGAMLAAGMWPAVAAGVAAIAGVFTLVLLGYVVVDAYSGQVTAARTVSHLPVLLGLVFALLVTRERSGARGTAPAPAEPSGVAPAAARVPAGRRGHLRPVSGAVSGTPRRAVGTPILKWVVMGSAERAGDDAVTDLALAAAGGDAAALEAFIKATQHDVWRFVAYLCDAASADDLTQETFLRAIRAIERFSGRAGARTWLLAIARRVVADHIRYLQSRPRTVDGADPEQRLNRDRSGRGFEDLVEVSAMIAHLRSDQREALLLTQVLGLSYADAAAVCGCPVGTIRSRVARARDALLADPERGELTG